MAYTYLSLVNGVLQRVNEVPLNSTNFASASGLYADVKNAVNISIMDINTQTYEWPFNHVTQSLPLVVGETDYLLPVDFKTIGWETFRIRGDNSLNNRTGKLVPIDYEEYLENFSDMEYNSPEYVGVPTNVVRNRDLSFTIIPPPDKAYTLDYEYYVLPIDLEEWDDVPRIPEQFKHTIHNGAMHYAYMFRGDKESAMISLEVFKDQIDKMRQIFIDRADYVRSTYRIRR